MSHAAALKAINLILWEHWDPLGCGVPRDEYESYAPRVHTFLQRAPSRDALADYLQALASDVLNLSIDRERAGRVAELLLQVGLA